MDLIASFSSQKINAFNFFMIRGIFSNNSLFFLFDTGAACPVVGINNFFDEEGGTHNRSIFEHVLRKEISSQKIIPRPIPLKTANNQPITTYPCVCHHVSIQNTAEQDFYFDLSFDDISIPLLGNSFIDDCAYSHTINGKLSITGMKPHAGTDYYSGRNVLDFDEAVTKFEDIC